MNLILKIKGNFQRYVLILYFSLCCLWWYTYVCAFMYVNNAAVLQHTCVGKRTTSDFEPCLPLFETVILIISYYCSCQDFWCTTSRKSSVSNSHIALGALGLKACLSWLTLHVHALGILNQFLMLALQMLLLSMEPSSWPW